MRKRAHARTQTRARRGPQRHTDALLERVVAQFASAVSDDLELGHQVCVRVRRMCICVNTCPCVSG
jgi:hypothetical protein